MKILNVGSLNIDHVYEMEHFVKEKETLGALNYHRNVGGKGLNQSIALSAAGLHVMHAGKIGADGDVLRLFLKEHQVDDTFLFCSDQASGHAIIQVVNGENSIIVYGGANQAIDEAMIDQVLSHFEKGDVLLTQNETSNCALLLEKAQKKGMMTILNPSPFDDSLFSCPLAACDMIIVNEIEGKALANCKSDRYETILQMLIQCYPKTHIVLTCGANGAWAYHKGKQYYQEAFRVPVVDTTCAGDTFTGFYIRSILQGDSISTALFVASKAASYSIQKQGAAISIPTWDEVMSR